ncbi:MAG: hypothetical protein SFV18_07065 [Bryobacteraceae bacterium]|nr:hypothetical protein [Bryobacteraceae bacterium]
MILLLAALAADASTLELRQPLKTPQTVLAPGTYMVRVADSLADRKIVEVLDARSREVRSTFLAAPNALLRKEKGEEFSFWPAAGSEPAALRAWFIPGEARAAEAVYEKNAALALAKENLAPVPAIDPESELPVKKDGLSKQDLTVLKLWSLNYQRVEAGDPQLQAGPLANAAWQPAQSRLPQTASPNGLLILLGALMLTGGLVSGRVVRLGPPAAPEAVVESAPVVIEAVTACNGENVREELEFERRRNLRLERLVETLRQK